MVHLFPAAEQAVQLGMHHDGLEFFPLNGSSTHGLIALNHEYTDDGLLHPDGFAPMNAAKVKKSQNAHGLSVYEVKFNGQAWEMVRPSAYARRFTMDTPFDMSGPAAGHPLLRTAADMDNLRKRAEREKAEATLYAATNFARDLLSVSDNMQRALDHKPAEDASQETKNLFTGIE